MGWSVYQATKGHVLNGNSPLEALHFIFHFKAEKFKCIFGILESAQPEAAQQKGIPRGIVRCVVKVSPK